MNLNDWLVPQPKITRTRISYLTIFELIKAMEPGDLTCQELAEESGLHYRTVLEFCKAGHRKGLIHKQYPEQDSKGRTQVFIYKWGAGKDKVFTPKSGSERSAAYRNKQKQLKLISLMAGDSKSVHNETK